MPSRENAASPRLSRESAAAVIVSFEPDARLANEPRIEIEALEKTERRVLERFVGDDVELAQPLQSLDRGDEQRFPRSIQIEILFRKLFAREGPKPGAGAARKNEDHFLARCPDHP